MKAMFTAFAAMGVISVGAWYGLGEYGKFSSGDRQSSPAVRVD